MYGIESVQLNDSFKKKLDTFQLKGLRRILGLKTTFIDRSNINEMVFATAQEKSNEEGVRLKKIDRLRKVYKDRRRKLTLDIIKGRHTQDPKTALTIEHDTLKIFKDA